MRKKQQKQMPLIEPASGHPLEMELEIISQLIDHTPTICDYVLQDLNEGKVEKQNTGAEGMSADQVIRAAVVMRLYSFTYEKLAFHIYDSRALRRFCRIGIADKGFGKSALNANIKRLSPQMWECISRDLLEHAKDENIEKGRKTRIDCTVVESNIHKPFDSVQLFDSVRVLTRLLYKARDEFGIGIIFTDHQHRAKRRMVGIQYAKGDKQRNFLYKDLLKVTRKTIGYAITAEALLGALCPTNIVLFELLNNIKHYGDLARQVYDQAYRRVIQGESVPAGQKVVSIFEEHTDVIVKDSRDTYYGHKICLTGGASNLILDCVILEGNPADTELVEQMLDRQHQLYGRYPLKVAMELHHQSAKNVNLFLRRYLAVMGCQDSGIFTINELNDNLFSAEGYSTRVELRFDSSPTARWNIKKRFPLGFSHSLSSHKRQRKSPVSTNMG